LGHTWTHCVKATILIKMKSFLKILVLAGTTGFFIARLIGGHAIKTPGSIAKLVRGIK